MSGAPPPPTARPLGGLLGSTTHVLVWGPNAVPLACMPCGACVPLGWRRAVSGGDGLPLLLGASGVRRCPSPGRPSSGLGSRGSATRVFRVRSLQAWGPSTSSTVCALAGRRCSLWKLWKGFPGGGCPPPL